MNPLLQTVLQVGGTIVVTVITVLVTLWTRNRALRAEKEGQELAAKVEKEGRVTAPYDKLAERVVALEDSDKAKSVALAAQDGEIADLKQANKDQALKIEHLREDFATSIRFIGFQSGYIREHLPERQDHPHPPYSLYIHMRGGA
jgi:hypothetical protein